MKKTMQSIFVTGCIAILGGCASYNPAISETVSDRCAEVFSEQTIHVSQLNDNAIAFLFGKEVDPKHFRQSTTEVIMTAYGSPIGQGRCQRWMSVNAKNEVKVFYLDGWNIQTRTQ